MSNNFQSKPFYYRLFGDYALFTDPVTKGGGEKFTYQIPTYQALKGITEQIYWKSTIIVYIDSIKVVNRIQTETKGVRTLLNNGKNDLNYYTYLRDVEYLVKFHFEWNYKHPELAYDRNEKKHEQIILRSLTKGGRRDIFLGTRECVGYVERIDSNEFNITKTHYYGEKISFGIMFHSFTYPSENFTNNDNQLISNFTDIKMIDGQINFIRPVNCEIHHKLGKYTYKKVIKAEMTSADEELDNISKEVI